MKELVERLEGYREMLSRRKTKVPHLQFTGKELTEVINTITCLRAEVKRLSEEVEVLMKTDYWHDRYKIEKARADKASGGAI